MKRIVSSILLSVFVLSTYAQMEKVTSAYDYLRRKQYDKAKDRIDIATENASSNTKAKTWQYRAYIYQSIATDKNPNVNALDGQAHIKCREAYLKAQELDVKGKYTKEIKDNLPMIERHFFVNAFNKYKAAYEKRQKNVADAAAMEGFKAAISDYNTYISWYPKDTAALFYRGMCSELVNDNEKALVDLKKCVELGKKDKYVYQYLFKIFKKQENWNDAIVYMDKASVLWPNDEYFLNNKIVSYDRAGKLDEVVVKLEESIASKPDNAKAHYLLGYTCSQLYNNESLKKADREKYANKSIEAYKKTIEYDPGNKRAYTDLGIVYYNLGVQKVKESGDAWKDASLSAKLSDQSKVYFKESITYNELHREKIDANDRRVLETLKNAYIKVNNKAKYDEYKAILEGK